MQIFGIFRGLKLFIFSAASDFRLSYLNSPRSKSFIIRVRLFIFTASEPALIILHTLFVKIGWKICELWPKTCFSKSRANPNFCTKKAPKSPILKISSRSLRKIFNKFKKLHMGVTLVTRIFLKIDLSKKSLNPPLTHFETRKLRYIFHKIFPRDVILLYWEGL